MTIHFNRTNRIANALSMMSRRRFSIPADIDRRIYADIGLHQSDLIALQIR